MQCRPEHQCYSCWADKCFDIHDYKRLTVSQYGYVRGLNNIKTELVTRGPLACSIKATDFLDEYKTGIYAEKIDDFLTNHVVSIVGYGVTKEGLDYW